MISLYKDPKGDMIFPNPQLPQYNLANRYTATNTMTTNILGNTHVTMMESLVKRVKELEQELGKVMPIIMQGQ